MSSGIEGEVDEGHKFEVDEGHKFEVDEGHKFEPGEGPALFGGASFWTVSLGDYMFCDTGKKSPVDGSRRSGYVEIVRRGIFRIYGKNGVSFPYSEAVVLTRDKKLLLGRNVSDDIRLL